MFEGVFAFCTKFKLICFSLYQKTLFALKNTTTEE
uniref:Uncharacterized protein n=1 Tax=Anguilla anguilla TaxID=7936 RepID=A0A0E9VNG5_ANGAN